MNTLIIGNIIALLASIVMVVVGYLKDKKKILITQTIQIGLFVISNLVLGGITGAIINVISGVRNILCYKEKLNKIAIIILIVISITFSFAFNNLGLIGLLPLASTVLYTLFMNTKDVIKFKVLILSTCVLWAIYDIFIKSYTSACFDIMTILTSIISMIQIKQKSTNKK